MSDCEKKEDVSINLETPIKKKRVLSQKQLENLKIARAKALAAKKINAEDRKTLKEKDKELKMLEKLAKEKQIDELKKKIKEEEEIDETQEIRQKIIKTKKKPKIVYQYESESEEEQVIVKKKKKPVVKKEVSDEELEYERQKTEQERQKAYQIEQQNFHAIQQQQMLEKRRLDLIRNLIPNYGMN